MNQAEDVEVILGHKRRYKFHSGTLARNSTLFADMLTEPNAAKLSNRARSSGIKIRWMVELTRLPSEAYPAGQLDLVELTPTGQRADGRTGMIVNENGRVPQANKAFTHYEAIFYSFYGKELNIDDSDMSTALSDCFSLLQIADYLGCTRLISKPIEVALLKHGQDLFRAIQGAPHAWIEMSHRIRSELIFRECVIHLVGNWKILGQQRSVNNSLRDIPGLRAVIEKYHRQLLTQAKQVELGVMGLYPGNMRLPVEDLPIKREAYAKDILVWMALTFYRHWVGQRLIMDKGRHGNDCGFELYRDIAAGGEAYMDKSVINQFHTRFPMTKKAMNVLENHLIEIKECMKEIIVTAKILDSTCQLDVNRFPVKYFTCVNVKREDFPWIREAEQPNVQPNKRQYKPGGNDIARQNLDTARMFQDVDIENGEDDAEEEGDFDGRASDEGPDTPMGKRARMV